MFSCSGSLVSSCCGEGLVMLSPSTLLRFPAALYRACPALHVVLALGCSTKAWTWLRLHFVPSPAQAAQAARSLTGTFSLGAARLLPSASPAPVPARLGCVCPVSSRDPPAVAVCRPSRISGSLWLETGDLLAVW